MSLHSLHKILSLAYFLPPLFFYFFSGDLMIGDIELDSSVISKLAFIIAFFMFGTLFAVRIFSKKLGARVEQSFDYIGHKVDVAKLKKLHFACAAIIFYYFIKISTNINSMQGRDVLFEVLEASLGPVYMLIFKIGIFLSAISLLKNTNYMLVAVFFINVALINMLTLSRSMLVVMLVALLPFVRIKPIFVIAGLFFIFLSRFILTGNVSIFTEDLNINIEWLRVFGFGEMLGVTFGPYAILKANALDLSFLEELGFIFHAIPGLSLMATYIFNVPEITIFVNQFTYKNYGLYGVAGTGYLDFLVSPVVFVFLFAVIVFSFVFFKFSKISSTSKVILFCVYVACAIATIQLYRWSFSGFVYSTARDCLIFIFIYYLIRSNKKC